MTPNALLDSMVTICPSFREAWETENPYLNEDGSFTFHSVFIEFASFFGSASFQSSTKQLQSIAALINSAIETPGALENAVSTCFLEHLVQIDGTKSLHPYLSKQALVQVRA